MIMGRFFVIFFCLMLLHPSSILADSELVLEGPIKKSPLSTKCKELFKEEVNQKKLHQRLSSLMSRSEYILKKTSPSLQKIQSQVQTTKVKIKHEIYLSDLKLKSLDEKIIRSGCPKAPFLDSSF